MPEEMPEIEPEEMPEGVEQIHGDPETWKVIVRSFNETAHRGLEWSMTTLAMEVSAGCVVRTATRQGEMISEALTFVPGTKLIPNKDGTYKIVRFGYVPLRKASKK